MSWRRGTRLERGSPGDQRPLSGWVKGEHLFRHEYGRLLAVLSRRVGVQHLEAVEDAVQSAMMAALQSWQVDGEPTNPSAWLYRVAQRRLIDELRRRAGRGRILAQHSGELGAASSNDMQEPFLSGEVRDSMLRMLFVCCDGSIPLESQLVFALKTLCGFNVGEIAERLFMSESNVYKRLARARQRLRRLASHEDVEAAQLVLRLPSVQKVLYLLFTEGYLSSRADQAIRRELCEEAIRLTTLLVDHPVGAHPESFALLALMHLHTARVAAREDASGGLLLLEEQDRSRWDRGRIQTGLGWLARSASGDHFSRYHAEAGIAAEHCLAPSFAQTRWDRVAECYAMLEREAPSAIHRLNRAVAVAEWKGAAEGLVVLEGFEPPTWLAGSYLWSAVLADLHRRAGQVDAAARYCQAALEAAPTPEVKALLARRLAIGDPS